MNARSDNQPQNRPRRFQYGVYWRDRRKPWIVKFKVNKRTKYIGSYHSYTDACTAADNFLKDNP